MADAAGLAEHVLATGAVDPRFDVARYGLWSGEFAAARDQIRRLWMLGSSSDLVIPTVQALYDLAVLGCFAGDFTGARTSAAEGARWARDEENPWAESHFAYPSALIETWTGPAADARAHVARLREMAESYGARPDLMRAHWLLGLLSLREQATTDSVASLASALELLDETGIVHPAPYPVLPDAVEAHARSGDVRRAEEPLARLEERAEAVQSPWVSAVTLRARGLVHLASGDPEGGLEPLSEAASALDGLGFRPDAARAVMARGHVLVRAGHRLAAADAFVEARDRFLGMGAGPWAARAAAELERVAPGRSTGDLTATETRVALLVAEGLKTERSRRACS
jgi:hypothetical protein